MLSFDSCMPHAYMNGLSNQSEHFQQQPGDTCTSYAFVLQRSSIRTVHVNTMPKVKRWHTQCIGIY